MESIKGRFAPSPTGRMHLGNAFCALLAWLSARSQGGSLLLRMEDLDPQRSRESYARLLMEDLRWLGLDWDEGAGVSGEQEELYWQSRRKEEYEKALAMLKQQELLYPCFCTRAELHAAEAPHASDGQVIYSGRCRGLTPQERQAKEKYRRPAIRIAVPEEVISFTDGSRGVYAENLARDCGDFILRRSDGVFAYQLAVTWDDGVMGVSQVVRGSDLLSSTPRQIWLQRLWGFPQPQYYHVPLLLAPDGRRLSKRDGDLDLGALRSRIGPEELIGKLAFWAGILPREEAVTPRELTSLFGWEKVRKQDILLDGSMLDF